MWEGTALIFAGGAQAVAVFTALFGVTAALAARRVLAPRRRPPPPSGTPDPLPPVTILKPLKGKDRGLYQNLASFCRQDYPNLQILFAIDAPEDPARGVVERLRADFPALDIGLVVSGRRIGSNPKINNLANAYPSVRHGLILIADSDVRAEPDFLRRAVAAMRDPRVGLVTSFYRTAAGSGLWGSLEALAINAHFLPQAAVAAAFGMRFAMGAAILVRREAFDAVGGFGALADHIADDFELGRLIQAWGYELAFAEPMVDVIPEVRSGSAYLRHHIRESRVIRLCSPGGYAGMALLHGFSLLTLKCLLLGPDALSLTLAACVLAARGWATRVADRAPGSPALSPAAYLLLPVSEWAAFLAWVLGFSSNRVLWRGVVYAVHRDGKLTPVGT